MTHIGKPIIRRDGNRIIVLCSKGHVLCSMSTQEWPGSIWEDRKTVESSGTILKPSEA